MSKIIKSVVFMFIVTLVFTSLVTAVKITNQDRIDRNREVKLQRTVLYVLGLNEGNNLTPREISDTFKKRIKKEELGKSLSFFYGSPFRTYDPQLPTRKRRHGHGAARAGRRDGAARPGEGRLRKAGLSHLGNQLVHALADCRV